MSGVFGFRAYAFDRSNRVLVTVAPELRCATVNGDAVLNQMLHEGALLPDIEWLPLLPLAWQSLLPQRVEGLKEGILARPLVKYRSIP